MIGVIVPSVFAASWDISINITEVKKIESANFDIILVKADLTNNGSEEIREWGTWISLIDDEKRKFSTSNYYDLKDSVQVSRSDCPIDKFDDINPGLTEEGIFCFKVPKTGENFSLKISDFDDDELCRVPGFQCKHVIEKLDSSPSSSDLPISTNVVIKTTQGSNSPGCEEILNGCFIPERANVNLGDKIVFLNSDTVTHTFTSGSIRDGPSGVFDSSALSRNSSFEWIADVEGIIPYFCMIHPWMVGTITVGDIEKIVTPLQDGEVIKLDKNIFSLSKYETTILTVSGKIDLDSRDMMKIKISKDKKIMIEQDVNISNSGEFSMPIMLDSQFMPGTYVVVGEFHGTIIDKVTFEVLDDSSKNKESNLKDNETEIIPKVIEEKISPVISTPKTNSMESDIMDETFKVVEEPVAAPQELSEEGGGCLIATATYGSELAPQVQQLRELRDNQLLQTESGTAFMGAFNDIYYSFSPVIADYERENPYFKEAVKLAITPMISSLSLMENAESESEVLSIGISVIMLNLGMYIGIPAIVVIGVRKIR